MSLAYGIAGIVLALMLLTSAYTKLTRNQQVVDGLTGLGVPLGMFPFLACCEIAGAVGLVIGIWWAPLGIAAAIGLVLYFVGAVGTHLRKSDYKGMPSPAVLLLASTAVLVLRILSA
ncbi:DoxX family protein [Streptomyces sp. NPDC000880]